MLKLYVYVVKEIRNRWQQLSDISFRIVNCFEHLFTTAFEEPRTYECICMTRFITYSWNTSHMKNFLLL